MKKALLTVACGVGVIVGALLLWKVVFPFLGYVLKWIFGILGGLF